MGRGSISPLLLLVAAAVASLSSAAAAATANSSDAEAILDFAKLLSNPPPSWVGGGDVCGGTFVGITCDDSGRVTGFDLKNEGLSGTLVPSLSSLTALTSLQLQGNALTGAIPSLARMGSLTRLSLDDNRFSSLPHDFLQGLTSLTQIVMDNIPVEPWTIPDVIANCTALEMFSAANASVSGAFPKVLANMKSLRILSLSFNYLTGGLPDQLGILDDSALEVLQIDNQISDVKLSGSIEVLASFKHLKVLWIQSNQFTGHMPEFNSPLNSLNVRDNLLTGIVPFSLMKILALESVWLSNNYFQGPMPEFRADVYVDMISGNSFCLHKAGPCSPVVNALLELSSGFDYPMKLAQTWAGNSPCTSNWFGVVCRDSVIVELDLPGQHLSGMISPALANLNTLERIDLSDNNITGPIPEALTSLSKLKFLDVSGNKIFYPLPSFKPSVRVIVAGGNGSTPPGSGSSKSKKQKIAMITGISLAAIILTIIVVCTGFYMHHQRKKKASGTVPQVQQSGSGATVPTQLSCQMTANSSTYVEESRVEKFPLNLLLRATNQFNENNRLGEGGGGVVFKGSMNGKLVAVKRCKAMGVKVWKDSMQKLVFLGK